MKLRIIVLILALIAFFSVSMGGYFYYTSLKESAFHEAERHMVTHTRVIKDRVSLFLSENLKSVKALAGLNDLQQALTKPDDLNLDRVNTILDHFKNSLQVNVCYLMNADGKTIASSNRRSVRSFVGKNYGFRPYFRHAIKGKPAVYMALGVTSGKRGVYYSHPVYENTNSKPIGVAIVKASIDRIEQELNYGDHAHENVILITDPNGVIFISDHENWLYRVLWKISDEQIGQIAKTRQFGNGPWRWSGLVLKDNNRAIKSSGDEYIIHHENIDNYPGWKIIHLSNLSSINRLISDSFIKSARYITLSICLIVGLSVFFLYNRASSDIVKRKINEEAQKKLGIQLQQSQRLESIGTLAGGIAHDFNNLLMTIEGSASLMLYDVEPGHPHYDILQNIEKQVRSGAKLTAQLLGYARKGKYEIKPVDLNYLVGETLETFGRTKKEIRIQRDLSDNLSIIEVDPGQIEQMLLNLCINASDAMPEGGDLKVKTANVTHKEMKSKVYQPTPGQYVLLTVTDSGIGMNQETQERIFEPFYTTKEMGRGTGLGLASVYGVIKSHGGFIDVESNQGRGTTFRIYLPASEIKGADTTAYLQEVIKDSGTILLVDDEQMVCAVGTQMLKKFGYTVLQAGSGREAIDLYKEKRDEIDLVVLDMIMPDLSGGKVYDRLKEINAQVTVLLSSGYSIDGQATEIMARGCDGFIQKPFNMKQLSQKVLEVLYKDR
ncbi:MAG: ATP-binding protein [Planctomycetota bacterium]